MIKSKGNITLGTAALISGLMLFIPAAPFAEFFVFGKLLVHNNAEKTTVNISAQPTLFLAGIFAMLVMFILDVVLSWTMYIFLRPVNEDLSLLASWFRIVYTGIAIVALLNLVYAYHMVSSADFGKTFTSEHVLQLVNARRIAMHFAYIVFGVYLLLSGALLFKASYVPKIIGLLILLAGGAWIIVSLQPYFFKDYQLSWLMLLAIGELVFGIWLLIRGRKVKAEEIIEYKEKYS